jgi:Ca2+-binding RTX toxin-like protein
LARAFVALSMPHRDAGPPYVATTHPVLNLAESTMSLFGSLGTERPATTLSTSGRRITAHGGSGDDELIGGSGNDFLDGGSGNNTVEFDLADYLPLLNHLHFG